MSDEVQSLVVKVALNDTLFQQGVSGLNKSMNTLKSEFKATTSSFSGFGSNIKKLGAESEFLGKSIELQKAKVNALSKAYEESKSKTGEYSAATNSAAQKLNNATAYLNKLESKLKEVDKEINKQGGSFRIFGGSIQEVTNKMKSASEGFKRAGTTMSMAVTLPLIGIGTACTKMAMDSIESENLFDVSMGKMAGSARGWSEQVSKSLGLNAFEVRKNVGVFNVMLMSMGATDKQALTMSESMTQLAYDMASFYNLKPEEAFEKLKAGISGESEPLKSLGILIDDASTKTYAYTHGIAQQGKELNNAQKIQARYGLIMQATSKAQGDLARTADSPVNKLRVMKEQLMQMGIQIGQMLIPVLMQVINVIKPLMDSFNALSQGQKEMIVKCALVAAAVGPVLMAIGNIIITIAGVVSAIGTISGAIASAGGILAVITGPIGWIALAIAALIVLFMNWDKVVKFVTTSFGIAKQGFANFGNAAMGIMTNIKNVIVGGFMFIVHTIVNVFNTITDYEITAFKTIGNIIMAALTTIKNIIVFGFMAIGLAIKVISTVLLLPFTLIWENCKGIVIGALTAIGSKVSTGMAFIGNLFSAGFNFISGIVMGAFNVITGYVSSGFGAIVNFVSGGISTISNLFNTGFNFVTGVVSGAFNVAVSCVSNGFSAICSFVSASISSIGNLFSSGFNFACSVVSGAFNSITGFVSNGFNSICNFISNSPIVSAASSVFNGVKNTIFETIEGAKNIVSGGISAIEGFFSGAHLSLPSIKLPHFGFSGNFSVNPPSVPTFNCDWYSSGGIFTQKTLLGNIGVGDFNKGAGTNAEAIVPLDEMYGKIDAIVKANNSVAGQPVFIVMDGRVIAKATAQPMSDELARLNKNYNLGFGR